MSQVRNYQAERRNYHVQNQLKPGYLLDMHEDTGDWRVGRVVTVGKEASGKYYVMVRSDGFSSKYTDKIKLPTESLAPLHRWTPPYTGPLKRCDRDELVLTAEMLAQHTSCMEKIAKQQEPLDCEYLNQYVRGELYIFIDTLLAQPVRLKEKDYREVMGFLQMYVRLAVQIVRNGLDMVGEVGEYLRDLSWFTVHPKLSYLLCSIELLDSLANLVRVNVYRLKFHSYHQDIERQEAIVRKLKTFMVESGVLDVSNLMLGAKLGDRTLPWCLRKGALTLVHLLSSTPPDLPEFDIRDAGDLFELFGYFGELYPQEQVEARQIALIFELIYSTSFERKLKGLNQLKNLIDRSQLRARSERLTAVLRDRNLVDYLTDNNNFNSELFRRSTPVFEFCIRQKCFRNEHLDRIVSLSRSRHESDLRLIYTVLADLAKQLPAASLDYLYSKLIQLDVDDLLLVLLREFTVNALLNLNGVYDSYGKRKIVSSEKYGLYGLQQLWQYLQDDSPLNSELTLLAVGEFVQLVLSEYCRQEREKYVVQCLRQAQKGTSFAQSLRVVQLIVKDYSHGIVSDAIMRLDKEFGVVESVTQTLTRIHCKELPSGKLTLDQCIENYFNFLEEVNPILRKSLSAAHVKTFWRMPKKDHLLSFLRRTRDEREDRPGKQFEKRLDSIFIRELIDSIFMVPQLMQNYRNMDLAVFQTIDELLMTYNIRKGNIDYNNKNCIRTLKTEGLDQTFYFRVLYAENSEKVFDAAMKRLVDLNIRPSDKLSKPVEITTKITMWMAFTERLFSELGKQPHAFLRVFRYFLQAIEGRMKSLNFFSVAPLTIWVKLLEPEQIKSVVLPSCSSIYKLRLRIDEEFGLNHTDFEIYLKYNSITTTFPVEEDFSLLMIQLNQDSASSPAIVVRPSKEPHPHHRALEKFHQQLAETRIVTLYEMLDQLPAADLPLMFEILLKLPKLKTLERKLLKLQLGEGGWNSLLSSASHRRLYYELNILQANKNPKWVMDFIDKKGVEHMIHILVRVEPQALGDDFNLKCVSLLIQLLSEYLRFLKNPNPAVLEQILSQLVQLMQSAVQHAGPLTMDFIVNGFRLLNSLIIINPGAAMMFFRHKYCKDILKYALFTENRKELNTLFLEGLKRDLESQAVREIVLQTILGFLNAPFLDRCRATCDTYFTIVNKLLDMLPKADWSSATSSLLTYLSNFLQAARKLAYQEKSSNDFDALLGGWLALAALVHIKTNLPLESIMKEKELSLAEWLLHDCLFPPLDKSQSAKCKSLRNRAEAFNILNLLPTTKEFCMQQITKLFTPILAKSAWRKQGEWAITVSNEQPRQFRGMKNMGATCYINSLMQQLFHLREFRQQLLKVEPGDDEYSAVLFELQKTFAYLQQGDALSYVPKSFCQAFRVDGQPIDPRMQMDADEFFNNLMDKVDNALKPAKQQHIINSIFQGELSNQLICEGCPHFSERSQDFLSLGVTIKNKPSLEQALKEFIKGEVLDGDNAYYCEKCEKKVRCLKRACIKQLPNVLMIVLKRFEFNFDTMEKIKLNDYCEFPLQLDMKPYTKEYLHSVKEPGEAVFRPDDYYNYELKGTVVHHGTSEAGHYYSYIRISDDKWMEFNDEWVEKFDLNDLKDETFGGAEELFEGEKKAKNAYILFYERKKNYIGGEPSARMVQSLPTPVVCRALQHVQEDNLKNQYVRVAFDGNLVRYLLANIGQNEGKLALLYYHLVLMRSRQRSGHLLEFHNLLEKLLRKDSQLAEWYLSQIGEPFLREFLFDAVKEVKYAVLSVLAVALKNSTKVCSELVKRCMSCLNRKGMTPFAKIFYLMSTTSKDYVKLLKEHDYPGRVIKLIEGPESVVKQPLRPLPSEFGESAGWDEPTKEEIDFNMLQHSLEMFDFRFEDIKKHCVNRFKIARSSLAKIIARGVRSRDYFEKSFQAVLLNELVKCEEERDLILYLRVVKELIEVRDDYAEERLRRLAEVHTTALKEHLMNYAYFNILMDGLIKFCSRNLAYRAKVVGFLSEAKYQPFKQFKKWLEDSGSPFNMIQSGRWTLWRKQLSQTQSKNYNAVMSCLGNKEAFLAKRRDLRLERFNKLLDKDEFEVEDAVEQLEWTVGGKYEYISSLGRFVTFEVAERAGLLYLLKIEGVSSWRPADDEIA